MFERRLFGWVVTTVATIGLWLLVTAIDDPHNCAFTGPPDTTWKLSVGAIVVGLEALAWWLLLVPSRSE